ncbi:MAG: prepilin-type N-terminal cleavage/methylation domain-containing protein [Planctomycetota bacterium]
MSKNYHPKNLGFTLIELVMVLVILAILATAALNVVEFQVDQTRFELTQQTVDRIDNAVLGPENARSADGSTAVSGFVADCGRLPLSLNELYVHPTTLNTPSLLPDFGFVSPAGDVQVTATGGWNGPYLKLAVGGTSLPDGWAAEFESYKSDGTLSLENEPIAILQSLGRNQEIGGDDYDTDLSLVFESDAAIPGLTAQAENRWQKSISAYVYFNDPTTNPDTSNGATIVVRVYGPVADAVTGTVSIGTIVQEQLVPDYTMESPVSIPLIDLAIGPRIVRVYQLDTMTAPTPDEELSGHADLKAVSVPTRLVVSRETTSVQLILKLK